MSDASILVFDENSRSWRRTRTRDAEEGALGGVFRGKVIFSRVSIGTLVRISCITGRSAPCQSGYFASQSDDDNVVDSHFSVSMTTTKRKTPR